jgi:hypothetical protein
MNWNYSSRHASPLLDERGAPLSWSLIEDGWREDCVNEPICSCFLGKVFAPIEGRNAWQYTWGESRFPIYPTNESACSFRGWSPHTQGTSRYWLEYPALVAAGRDYAVVLIETQFEEPYHSCAGVRVEEKTSLFEFAGMLPPLNLVKICCAKKEAMPASLPFRRWHSGDVIKVDLTHACEFIKRMTLHLQEAGSMKSPIIAQDTPGL